VPSGGLVSAAAERDPLWAALAVSGRALRRVTALMLHQIRRSCRVSRSAFGFGPFVLVFSRCAARATVPALKTPA
jgi:hypothetical protein